MSPWLTADRKDGNGSDGCSDEVALSHISDSATLNSIDGCGDKNDEDDDGNKHGDSIWNYHCWCEVWLPDNGQGAWFVCDGTPQEPSNYEPLKGSYVCGPCPISAINNVYHVNKEEYFDIKFISVNCRGVVSQGVEYDDEHLRIFYYRDYHGTGTDIYTESNNSSWIDVKSRYQPSEDFPYQPYDYSMSVHNNIVTLSGNVPSDIKVYLIVMESKHRHSGPPSAKGIESYEVIPLTDSNNNQWKYSQKYIDGWSHAFVVAGVKTKVKYTKTHILKRWISQQL